MAAIVLLLLWIIMFGGATVLNDFFGTSFSFLQNNGDYEFEPPSTSNTDCRDLNIGDEYQEEFGLSTIQAAKTACLGAGGIWTDAKDELSCAWPAPVPPFDCTSYDWIDGSLDFCVDELGAFFYCSPSIAYIGCYCDIDKPVADDFPWNEEEDDDQGDQTDCELSYPFCDASCDSGQWCMEIVPQTLFFSQPWCDCVPLYDDSDCDDFCQSQYGYDYGNLAHSHYDCSYTEEYIDGCCCGYLDDGQGDEPPEEPDCNQECAAAGHDYGGYWSGGISCSDFEAYLPGPQCCCYPDPPNPGYPNNANACPSHVTIGSYTSGFNADWYFDMPVSYCEWVCSGSSCDINSQGDVTPSIKFNWLPLDVYVTCKGEQGEWDSNHDKWNWNPTDGNLICEYDSSGNLE